MGPDRSGQPVGALRRTDLGSAAGVEWTVAAARDLPRAWEHLGDRRHPARVPGEIHTDLLAAGLIGDPFDGEQEASLTWIGRTDWVYRASFAADPARAVRHDLVADGLDTCATVTLNGRRVGQTANQHRSHRFDVTSLLRPGSNDLQVAFEAPVLAARRWADDLGDRPRASGHPYNALRKTASSFGWDWGPDLAGVGIWRPIALESWSTVRLAGVRPVARVDGVEGHLVVHVDLEWEAGAVPGTVAVVAALGQGLVAQATARPGQTSVSLTFRVPRVRRWWPVGYGDQTLYPVRVEVGGQTWAGRVGFREVTVSTEPDRHGTGFTLSVNGRPVYVKGANWVPGDALLTRMTTDRYAAAVADATEAGMNLLRVWGGGRYEDEALYAACDERGVLVWQDFGFACAAYAEEDPLHGEVEAEAREVVSRLSGHACLALWNGGNENHWGYVDWGWRAELGDRSWGDGYYTGLLPRLVAELAPRTPYTPGTPYSFAPYHHPNHPSHGTTHLWEVWNRLDYRHYRDTVPRFVTEFGFQGPPGWSTLTRVVHDQPLHPHSRQLRAHQKASDGQAKLERGLGDHLPRRRGEDPTSVDMDDWHWATSLNQARAVAYAVEHFRSHVPVNSGSVVWQLNDCWPAISWSAVDSAGIRKPVWYALRRAFAPRLLTLQPRPAEGDDSPDGPAVVAHNDTDEPWATELTVRRHALLEGSRLLAEDRLALLVPPRSTRTVALRAGLRVPSDPTGEVLVGTAAGAEPAYGYFLEDPALRLCPPGAGYDVQVARRGHRVEVTVAARALVKDLMLFPDRLDPAGRVDAGLVTLLAGQSQVFTVTGLPDTLETDALATRPVLRTANDLLLGG